jgi:hypothetical protein
MVPRGPSGAAPSPPDWLPAVKLPLRIIGPNVGLWRVHPKGYDPVFFGPGPGNPPVFRFDAPDGGGQYGVLYVGLSFDAAIVETLFRNPAILLVDEEDLDKRSVSTLKANRKLRLAKAFGPGLARIGTTNAISTGPYDACALWSQALFKHPDRPDGILYQSSHSSRELCAALFEREDLTFSMLSMEPVKQDAQRLARVFKSHRRSIAVP